MTTKTAPTTITIKTGRAGGTAADGFKYHDTFAEVKVGDFLEEFLVTDTIVYEVIKVTKATVTVRKTVGTGVSHKDPRCDEGGHGLSVQWEEVEPWENGWTKTFRVRKDGSLRSGSHVGASPLRPAHRVNGIPAQRRDWRF